MLPERDAVHALFAGAPAAVCDINEALAQSAAAEYGCKAYVSTREMYEKERPDVVFLCVSPELHPQLAIEAFDAGVHVWMEKPPAMRAEDVERMMERRGDRVAVVGFKIAFMPAAQKAIEIVRSDRFGPLLSMLAVYPLTIPEDGREILEKRKYTNWLGTGVHPLALLVAVGGKAEAVTVRRSRNGFGVCLIDFAGGVSATFHLASGPFPIESYRFFGSDWHLEIENSLRVKLQRGIPFDYMNTKSYIPEGTDSGMIVWEPQNHLATLENKALFTQGFYNEMKYFCDCVLEGKPAEQGSLEFALEVMKVYEAALLSDGKTVPIT
mgnify:CR=1 FL=1